MKSLHLNFFDDDDHFVLVSLNIVTPADKADLKRILTPARLRLWLIEGCGDDRIQPFDQSEVFAFITSRLKVQFEIN